MTPAKRRPATPAREGRTRAAPAPEVPIAPPDAPVPDELVIAPVPLAETTPPTETGEVAREDRAATQSPRRPLSLYPLPVWPD